MILLSDHNIELNRMFFVSTYSGVSISMFVSTVALQYYVFK